tara:strand:- start:5260 stop:6423 length:1164 start_codon:yes stop_codon:yes gene_type:complete
VSWPVVELSEVCSRVSVGHVGKTSEYYTDETGIPFLRTQNVSKTGLNMSDVLYVTHEFHEKLKKSQLFPGDVVLSRVISSQINCAVIPNGFGVANCANIILVRPDPTKLDSEFLNYYLKSEIAQRNLMKRQVGSAQSVVNTSVLKSWEIPLPPLDEQKRIAAILDKADSVRRKRQQAIDFADDFLRSVFLDMFGDPVTNPKGWEVYRMGDVIDFKGGHQPPKDTFIYEPKEGYVRLIQIRDFKSDKYLTYIPEAKAKRHFEKDDVMIARYGPPVFQILRGLEGSYNVALMKAIPKGKILKSFIYYLLQVPAYHDVVVANSERTAGQTGVNLDLLNNFSLPLPPVSEQEKIIKTMTKMEIAMKRFNKHGVCADDLFNSLSQKAFAGEL